MSKLTKAVALLAPLGSESDPLHGFFDPERRKAMRTLLDQIENDRRQIAQLNAKHQERVQQLKNQGIRLGLLRDQATADTRTINSLRANLNEMRATAENIAHDRNYWQGEARRLGEALEGSEQSRLAGEQKLASTQERLLKYEVPAETEIKNEHQAHVEFHLRTEKNERLLRRAEEAEEKLSRIAEIIGTTDVPEGTLLARRQLPLDAILVELFDAKLKAVAEILDED